MRFRHLALIGALTLVLGAACAASAPAAPARPADSVAAPAPTAAPARQAAAPAGAPKAAESAATQQNLPGLDRMIIRNVTLTIGVGNVQEAFRQVEQIAFEQGGLIASSQIRQDGERVTATMTVRVPSDPQTYRATLERLRAIADRVIDEQSQAQDITEEYVDLESRLRNLRATEDSLIALLNRAQRIEDVIQIQRELTNVRGQIEQIQGRKQALDRRVEMATITLTIRETASVSRGGWNLGGTAAEALESLLRAVRGITAALIWLVIWLPLWGGLLLIVWLLWRRRPRLSLNLDPPRRTTPAGAPPPAGGGA